MHNSITRIGMFLVLTGCQPLADSGTEGVALATLRGTLSLAQGVTAPKAGLHVAVIWQDPNLAGEETLNKCENAELSGWRDATNLLQQRALLSTEFPSGYSVDLTEPPPPAAFFHDVGNRRVSAAYGLLVIFEDRNGNNRLDPSSFDQASPDLVLGSSKDTNPLQTERKQYTIVYLSDDLGSENEEAAYIGDGKAGYSLEAFEISPFTGTQRLPAQRLSDATIDLTLDPTAYVQQMACALQCAFPPETFECPDDPRELVASDLGDRLSVDLGVGGSAWLRQDAGKAVYTTTKCAHPPAGTGTGDGQTYQFDYSTYTVADCRQTGIGCTYIVGATSAESANLPCTEYDESIGRFPTQPNEPPQP